MQHKYRAFKKSERLPIYGGMVSSHWLERKKYAICLSQRCENDMVWIMYYKTQKCGIK